MNLATDYLGMKLRTPIVPAASPLSEDLDSIKRMEDAGAAAVVCYSLFEEQIRLERYELDRCLLAGTESYPESLTYFPEPRSFKSGPASYAEHIARAKAVVDIPVIASLNGSSLGGWTDYAQQIEQAGADALELNIYRIPTDMDQEASSVEQGYIDILSAVRTRVTIPVAVKVSPFFSNFANMAKRLDKAGADALVLFNRFYQPDIDLETLEVAPNVLQGMFRRHGTLAAQVLGDGRVGEYYGAGLTEREVGYLMEREWARTAEDVLWRRTKCGLRMTEVQRSRVARVIGK